jgi:hypothetical protein
VVNAHSIILKPRVCVQLLQLTLGARLKVTFASLHKNHCLNKHLAGLHKLIFHLCIYCCKSKMKSSTEVECTQHYFKVEGLSPATTAGTGRGKKLLL